MRVQLLLLGCALRPTTIFGTIYTFVDIYFSSSNHVQSAGLWWMIGSTCRRLVLLAACYLGCFTVNNPIWPVALQ